MNKSIYVYCLYDEDELPVLITDSLQELSDYLGRSSLNSLKVTLTKYFKRKSKKLEAHLEDDKGKKYQLYKLKEN